MRFVQRFTEWARSSGEYSIIEGVRHKSVADTLAALAHQDGKSFHLVFVDTDRVKRAERRTEGDLLSLERVDRHPVEAETDSLAQTADIVISGEAELDASITAIDALLTAREERR